MASVTFQLFVCHNGEFIAWGRLWGSGYWNTYDGRDDKRGNYEPHDRNIPKVPNRQYAMVIKLNSLGRPIIHHVHLVNKTYSFLEHPTDLTKSK
jgi:hypothetical protein